MSDDLETFVSAFSQVPLISDINPKKKTFKVVVADKNTVATSPKTGRQATYHPKSHVKALDAWKGRPLIVNHGKKGWSVYGKVIDADIGEQGLIHTIEVEDERMLEILEKKLYEGFSIGTGLPKENIESAIIGDEMLSYIPVELSVIMYPEEPACPRGVCDIISMTSCKHQPDVELKTEEVKNMANETPNATPATPCGCKEKQADMISSAQHLVAMSAKDEQIKELAARLSALEADVKSKDELFNSAKVKLADYELKEKLALAAPLPQDKGINYGAMTMEEIQTLLVVHNSAKAAVVPAKTEDAGALEVATKNEDKTIRKPWLNNAGWKPGL